jgi:hypothetical protein
MPRKENQTQAQTQETQNTQYEQVRQILQQVKEKSLSSNDWVSEPLIRGEYVVVTASANKGSVTLWIKGPRLFHGYAIPLDSTLEDRLSELEDTISTLKSLVPILKEFITERRRSTVRNDAPIVIRRKF